MIGPVIIHRNCTAPHPPITHARAIYGKHFCVLIAGVCVCVCTETHFNSHTHSSALFYVAKATTPPRSSLTQPADQNIPTEIYLFHNIHAEGVKHQQCFNTDYSGLRKENL